MINKQTVLDNLETVKKYIQEAESENKESYEISYDLKNLIKKCKFDWFNDDINDDNLKLNIELWHPNKYFSNGDEVIAEFKKNKPGYRFATLPELLNFASVYPELQRSFPIGALGSIWLDSDRVRRFACLYRNEAGRFLHLSRLEYDFSDDWRFAVVREHDPLTS